MDLTKTSQKPQHNIPLLSTHINNKPRHNIRKTNMLTQQQTGGMWNVFQKLIFPDT